MHTNKNLKLMTGILFLAIIAFLIYRNYFPVVDPIQLKQAKTSLPMEQEKLLNAVSTWQTYSNASYQINVDAAVGNSYYIICPISQITYQDGKVTTFEGLSPNDNEDTQTYCLDFIEKRLSMASLFEKIKADLAAGPESVYLVVEYDPQFGYISHYKRLDVNCFRKLGGGDHCHEEYRFSNLILLETQP